VTKGTSEQGIQRAEPGGAIEPHVLKKRKLSKSQNLENFSFFFMKVTKNPYGMICVMYHHIMLSIP